MTFLPPTRVLCALLLILGLGVNWAHGANDGAVAQHGSGFEDIPLNISSYKLDDWIHSKTGAELSSDDILQLLGEADNFIWDYFPPAWLAGLFGINSAKTEEAD